MPNANLTAHEIVTRLGGHAAGAFGIDLDDSAQLDRWLVAVCLTGARVDEVRWQRAFVELDRAGLADPHAIATPGATGDPDSADLRRTSEIGAELEATLRKAEFPDADRVAWKLMRVSATLAEHYTGSVDRLVRGADSLAELGGRLAALAPGFGTASVTRFLRPLRDRWIAVDELPLHATAHAAAVHLGLIGEDQDPDGAVGALRAAIRAPDAPSLRDLEAALERLGAWCRRNRTKTCPLEASCPARASQPNP